MSGDKVWDAYLDGQIDAIRNYCETDVLNTYLIFLRFELMRGRLLREEYLAEVARVRDVLTQQAKPHFQEFLAAWHGTALLSAIGRRSSTCPTTGAVSHASTARPSSSTTRCRASASNGGALKRGRNFDEGRLRARARAGSPIASSRAARISASAAAARCSTSLRERQLEFKQRQLYEALTRIGKVTPREILPPLQARCLELSAPRAARGALGAEEGAHGRRLPRAQHAASSRM